MFWPMILRKERFDLLLTMQLSPLCLRLANTICLDAGFIWNFFGSLHPFGYTEQMLRIFVKRRPFDAVIVESPSQGKQLTTRFGVKSPIIVAAHIGNLQRGAWKSKFPGADGIVRLSFIGRLWRYKGIFFILEIWESLKVGSARLDFYGHGRDIEPLRAEVRRRKLEGVVTVHGPYRGQSELSNIMSKTDLVLLPSEIEGLPLVLLEAMAHGVPFVASDVGVVKDLLEANPDVRVVPLEKASFISAIEEMVARVRAGTISAARIQNNFERRFSRALLEGKWAAVFSGPTFAR
jgi:glycosyltransferase involved in cell wall biosynthesis